MADDNGPLTFDALSAVYRMEKNSPVLSTIRKDFYKAAQELIAAQVNECDRLAREDPDSFVYEGAVSRKNKILNNLKTVVEYRMNKIAGLAMRGARGANNVIDHLTDEEKDYYNKVLEVSKEFWKLSDRKKKVLISKDITEIATPKAEEMKIEEPVPEPPVVKKPVEEDIPLSEIPIDDLPEDEVPVKKEEIIEDEIEEPIPEPPAEPIVQIPEPEPEPIEEGNLVIRILEDLPPFSGPEVDYVLKKEDIVCMPAMMANVLISRGKARLVSTV